MLTLESLKFKQQIREDKQVDFKVKIAKRKLVTQGSILNSKKLW